MIWVSMSILSANTKTTQRNDTNYLGSSSGLSSNFPPIPRAEEGPLAEDLATAQAFGQPLAELVQRWERLLADCCRFPLCGSFLIFY